MTEPTVLLAGGRLANGELADVLITGEQISAIRPAGHGLPGRLGQPSGLGLPGRPGLPPGARLVDATGYLLLAAPVEAHSHFDKVLTAEFLPNEQGDLESAVRSWYGYRSSAQHAEIVERAGRAARWMLRRGSTAIRTHVDVGESVGLRFVTALAEVRASLAGELDLEVVAFVDVPTTGVAGRRNQALLRESLAAGADCIGGAPYRDPEPVRCQRELLTLAAEFGVAVDLHTDEVLDATVSSLTDLAELTVELGLNRVAASHCVSLSLLPQGEIDTIGQILAGAGVSVVCSPATNLYLQARAPSQTSLRGIAPLRALLAAGVTVAGGGDNIQDPFNPLGAGDALETAALLVLAGRLSIEEAYRAVSRDARRVMGLPPSELAVGDRAEILGIRADSLRQAIANRSDDRLVLHRGRLIAVD
ncbi:MAG: amidohydrolase family protein [Actinomycetota bacterium]|nr:amidohydrolase family protein [Actinomycetota bacterium]MDQ2956117.1 amidohydrolase family protein [Actinomycetota bacterium]